MNIIQNRRERMMAGAYAYSQFDKSDPFAYSRAVSHINNGVADIGFDGNGQLVDRFYSAERGVETRSYALGDKTVEYQAEVYHNARRP